MFEYKIEELIFNMPNIQNIINDQFNGDFLKYVENFINEYVAKGWNLYSPNIITNPFGGTIRAILIFEREKL